MNDQQMVRLAQHKDWKTQENEVRSGLKAKTILSALSKVSN